MSHILSHSPRHGAASVAFLLSLCSSLAFAAEVTVPYNFNANTPAVAAQVNANFNAVKTAVNSNNANHNADIAALQAALTSLQTQVNTQQTTINAQASTIAALTTQIAVVQNSSVMELANYLNMIDVPDPVNSTITYLTAEFSGINVRVVNGLGSTATTNGLGNLSVGYGELDPYSRIFCSNGYYDTEADCVANDGIWAKNQRSGSHNLITGLNNSYTSFGGFLAGYKNVINNEYASVSGGYNNTASGHISSVSGGNYNIASGRASSVSGGYVNTASHLNSSVSGGWYNTASGMASSVSGGSNRSATGQYNWRAGTYSSAN